MILQIYLLGRSEHESNLVLVAHQDVYAWQESALVFTVRLELEQVVGQAELDLIVFEVLYPQSQIFMDKA